MCLTKNNKIFEWGEIAKQEFEKPNLVSSLESKKIA